MPILNRRTVLLGTALPLLSGCASAAFVANYETAKTGVVSTTGIDEQDLQDLRSGRIDLVRQRYESRGAANLSPKQLLLLSDIYLKYGDFGKASTTLALYISRTGDRSEGITGRQALIALALGQPARAQSLATGSDEGSRYVRALAAARTGDKGAARTAAGQFGLSYEPKLVYYAANLYSAVGDNRAALGLLTDPSRRLLRDYGVSTLPTLFGPGKTAPFRLDIFNQFSAGWFDVYSYAPAANVYVEYLAAHSLLELGQTQEAVQHLDALLAYPGLPAYRDVEWLVLYDRGRAAKQLGRPDDARRYFQHSIEDVESMRRSVSSDQGRIGFAADKQAVYAAMVDLLLAAGQLDAALSYSERARSRSLVDLLASRNDIVPAELSASRTAALLNRLDLAEGQLSLASTAADPQSALRASDAASVRSEIAAQAPTLAPLISVSPVGLEAIRSALAPDETAVAYYHTGSTWVAFLVGRGALTAVSLPASDMNQLVLALLRSVTSSQDTPTQCRAGYNALVAPVRGSITTNRVLFVPFGILHYVPFSALHDGNVFLIESFSIRQVPSLSALTVAERNRANGAGSLIIGNPARPGDAPSLPSAQLEAERVSRLLPGPVVLIGPAATLAAFRQDAPGKAYLHIASHGQFDAQNPLGSRLLLAPDPGDTGDLTVGSLYATRLNARLVTLSACETAVSELSDGDDLVGLVRGFLFAGAQNVIATLWEISDQATSVLMTNFYRKLETTHSVPESLRQAQIETMRTYPQPFYWAAFVPTSFAPVV
jgi:CHAT domain-containing protein/tetratricopeptide (TPR) repeat protein